MKTTTLLGLFITSSASAVNNYRKSVEEVAVSKESITSSIDDSFVMPFLTVTSVRVTL